MLTLLQRHPFPILLLGVVLSSLGIWQVGVPLGDEGVHVLQALNLAENGGWSLNLYYSVYAFLFRFVTDDPVTAHILMRGFVVLATTCGLYAVLINFRGISRTAVLITCLIWASSSYVSNYYQISNYNSFAFALALPGLALLLRYPGLNSLLVFLFGTFWAAMVRPEYYASLAAVSLVSIGLILTARKLRFTPQQWRNPIYTSVLAVLLAASVWHAQQAATGRGSLNDYLLQGLGQCYAVHYLKHHPEESFDPMTEYQVVLDKVFGHPRNFVEALRNNPGEAAHYFAANTAKNLGRLVPGMVKSKNKIKLVLALLVFVAGTTIGLYQLKRQHKLFVVAPSSPEAWHQRFKLLMLLAFAAASSAAIILLIPDPRYWISWAPLIYLWLAWAVDELLQFFRARGRERMAVMVILLVLSIPHLFWAKSNREELRLLQEAAKEFPQMPIYAGNFVQGLATFTVRGHATVINTYNGLSPEHLRQKRYDMFESKGLENTSLWQKERAFLNAFTMTPEKFGYRELKRANGTGTDIYVRTR